MLRRLVSVPLFSFLFLLALPLAAVAAPSFVAATSATNGASATSITVAHPSGVAAGDLLVASVNARGQPSFTPPTEWTFIQEHQNSTTAVSRSYWHRVDSSEPAQWTWTFSSSKTAVAAIVAYRGVTTAVPVDVFAGQVNSTASSSVTAPSVTTSTSNTTLLFIGSMQQTGSFTPPTGMTERVDIANPGTYPIKMEIADEPRATAGSTGARTATATTSFTSIGQAVALKPGNGAPTAVNDGYSTTTNQRLTVASPGVLANDSDPDGDSLTAVKVSSPSNGSLVLNSNGSFTYTPNANFTGTDSFTYKASDGSAQSQQATVTINVAIYRAFSGNSYWNTPMPTNAPIDARSSEYVADSMDPAHTQNYLKLRDHTNAYAQPIYWASSSDPVYTVYDKYNRPLTLHIPSNAQPAPGTDQNMAVFDRTSGYNLVADFSGATYDSATDTWTTQYHGHQHLGSNGLDGSLPESNDTWNRGHRGLPFGNVGAVRMDEVLGGAIAHRLSCFWHATGTVYANHYWPMVGNEGQRYADDGHAAIVPEGIVIRIKPAVDLDALVAEGRLTPYARVVAEALQDYGCMVGDNSGSGNGLKLQRNVDWTGILGPDSLISIPFSDWEFVRGGYDPVSGTVK